MLSARMEQALEGLKRDGANRVVVTHAIVVKASAVALITARPLDSVFKMDIAPLSCTVLCYRTSWSIESPPELRAPL